MHSVRDEEAGCAWPAQPWLGTCVNSLLKLPSSTTDGGVNNRNEFSPRSGGWKSEIMAPAQLGEGSFLVHSQHLLSMFSLTWWMGLGISWILFYKTLISFMRALPKVLPSNTIRLFTHLKISNSFPLLPEKNLKALQKP